MLMPKSHCSCCGGQEGSINNVTAINTTTTKQPQSNTIARNTNYFRHKLKNT